MLPYIYQSTLVAVNAAVVSTIKVGEPVRFVADDWVLGGPQTISVCTLAGAVLGKLRSDKCAESVGRLEAPGSLLEIRNHYWIADGLSGEIASISGGLGGGYKVSVEYWFETAYYLDGTPKDEEPEAETESEARFRTERDRDYRIRVNKTHKMHDRCLVAVGDTSPRKYLASKRSAEKIFDMKEGRAGAFDRKKAELARFAYSAAELRRRSLEEIFEKEVRPERVSA